MIQLNKVMSTHPVRERLRHCCSNKTCRVLRVQERNGTLSTSFKRRTTGCAVKLLSLWVSTPVLVI